MARAVTITIAAVLLGFSAAWCVAHAHSWYPMGCCNSKADSPRGDCEPVPCDELVENQDGTWKYHKTTFQRSQVHPSLDQFCHACVARWDPTLGLCAFVQMDF